MFKTIYIYIVIIVASNCSFASSIGIGCCRNDISICRYWEMIDGELKEKILIFNKDTLSTNVQITISTIVTKSIFQRMVDLPQYAIVGGPWEIAASRYIVVNMPFFNALDSSKFFFKISKVNKDTTIECGHIIPYNEKPATVNDSLIYYSTQSINGIESRINHFWWEQKSLFLKSEQPTTINLNLLVNSNPNNEFRLKEILVYKWADSTRMVIFPTNITAAKFIKQCICSRDSLIQRNPSIEYILSYTLPPEENSFLGNKIYCIKFNVIAPRVTESKILLVSVFIDKNVIKRQFSLPIIVNP